MKKNKKPACFTALLLAACLCGGCGKDASAMVETRDPLLAEESSAGSRVSESDSKDSEEAAPVEENGGMKNAGTEDMTSGEEKNADTKSDNTVTITISAAGDVTLGNYLGQDYARSFVQTYEEQGKAYFFQNVLEYFLDDDMTIVNFEGVLTESEEVQVKDYNMKGEPEYVYILTEGSVEAVSFGNNHRLDYLAQGSKDTVDMFEEAGIAYAYDTVTGIYETKGIRIGFVSVNEASQGAAVEKYLKEGIAKLREEEEAD